MKKFLFAIIIYILLFISFPFLAYANPPKLLFIPIENLSKSKKYHYISGSVTKAVLDDIREKFAFREINFSKVKKIAKANGLVYKDEFYLKSVSLQLGLLLKQDIVISGYFTDKGSYLAFNIFIQEVRRKKLVSKIKLNVKVDNRMFAELKKVSNRVAREASTLLPNKQEFKKKFYVENQIEYGNIIYFGPAYRLPLSKGVGAIGSSSITFKPVDFEHMIDVNIGYRRHYIYTYNLYIFGSMGVFIGKGKKDVVDSSDQVKIEILGFSILAGLGYQFNLHRIVYLMPQLAVGFTYGKAVLDLGIANKIVTDPNLGKYIDQLEMEMYGPILEPTIILGFNATDVVKVEISTGYCAFFEMESVAHEMKFGFNIAFGF